MRLALNCFLGQWAFKQMGMVFEKVFLEIRIKAGLIQRFGFGEKINGYVCRALEIRFLQICTGKGRILKGGTLKIGLSELSLP